MFLELQKITTSNSSKKSPIIINSSAILKIETDQFEDKETRTMFDATRLELIGYPKYTFYTLTSMDVILDKLTYVDVTNGFVPGSTCAGGNSLGISYPEITYPIIKAPRIFNNTVSESDVYAFNPTCLIYTEEFTFNDSMLNRQSTAMMVVLRETSPLKIPTAISYEVMSQILKPVKIQ